MESHFYDSRIKFKTYDEAETKLSLMSEHVDTYGVLTMCNLYEICELDCNYEDRNLGWLSDMVDKGEVVSDGDYYTIKLPRAIVLGLPTPKRKDTVRYRSYYTPLKNRNTTNYAPQPEPIAITIHTNEIDVHDPDEIISDVFKHITQIKDRMINITIM